MGGENSKKSGEIGEAITSALLENLNIPEPERFAQQAIVTALRNFVEVKETAALDYGDEEIDPAEVFKMSGFVGCAEGDPGLSRNYKQRLTQYWAEKHGHR